MFWTTTVGWPGRCLPRWRAIRRSTCRRRPRPSSRRSPGRSCPCRSRPRPGRPAGATFPTGPRPARLRCPHARLPARRRSSRSELASTLHSGSPRARRTRAIGGPGRPRLRPAPPSWTIRPMGPLIPGCLDGSPSPGRTARRPRALAAHPSRLRGRVYRTIATHPPTFLARPARRIGRPGGRPSCGVSSRPTSSVH